MEDTTTVLMITVQTQTIATCQFTLVVAGHFVRFAVPGISYYIFLEAGNHKGMKRAQAVSTTLPPSKKRSVTIKTVEKWISENDKDLATAVWLKFEKAGQQCVAALKCSVCTQYEERLYSCRHFKRAFIDGSSNLRCSSFKDHATTDMHQKAMKLEECV